MTCYTIFTTYTDYNASMFGTANNDSILGFSHIFFIFMYLKVFYIIYFLLLCMLLGQ